MAMKSILQLAVVHFAWLLIGCQKRSSTYTEWRTIISTVEVTSTFVCAQLVNVTGRCRQSRGVAVEPPVARDIDVDEFYPLHSHESATPTWRVESTPLIVSPDWPMDGLLQSPAADIEASMGSTTSRRRRRRRRRQLAYFSRLTDALFNPIASVNVTVTNVLTHTWSRTTTTTASFSLVGCTPSPLPYATCPASSSFLVAGVTTAFSEGHEGKGFHFHRWKDKRKKHPLVTVSTVTRTSTATTWTTSSTVALCARLVNVTGPCRRRRGFRMEDPVVLSFDDDMDSIDSLLSPSQTFSIETTVEPIVRPSSARWALHDGAGRLLVTDATVRSSAAAADESAEEAGSPRLGFGHIFGLKSALKKVTKSVTLVTTVSATAVSTSLAYVTISTKTFFVQICTPSPFPFDVCVRAR